MREKQSSYYLGPLETGIRDLNIDITKKTTDLTLLSLLYIRTSNLFHKKYSQKCSHSNDFPCNVLKLTKRKNTLNAFFFCINSY